MLSCKPREVTNYAAVTIASFVLPLSVYQWKNAEHIVNCKLSFVALSELAYLQLNF